MTTRWKDLLDAGEFDVFEAEMDQLQKDAENLRSQQNAIVPLARQFLRDRSDLQAKQAYDDWISREEEIQKKENLRREMWKFSRDWAWDLFNSK